jgi:rhomboid protease GluP
VAGGAAGSTVEAEGVGVAAGARETVLGCEQPARITAAHKNRASLRGELEFCERVELLEADADELIRGDCRFTPSGRTHIPDSLFCSHVLYYKNATIFSQGTRLELSPRLRWKLDRFREQVSRLFGGTPPEQRRPQLCPACGTLVGATATKCHQCGASLTFGMAAATRSLSRWMPTESPVTYGILTLSCLLYAATLIATIRETGLQAPGGGGLGALMGLGGISNSVLIRFGASVPWPFDLIQPWRLVMATFLHGSLLHIAFNMWVLMDIGPQIEELYGSARYLFLYVATGIGAFLISGLLGRHVSIGGSGALLGLIGVLLAMTMGHKTAAMQMLRSQLIRWLVYIGILGIMMSGTDNFAHAGGLITGFLLGRVMVNRPPMSDQEKTRATLLGWTSALVVIASLGITALGIIASR